MADFPLDPAMFPPVEPTEELGVIWAESKNGPWWLEERGLDAAKDAFKARIEEHWRRATRGQRGSYWQPPEGRDLQPEERMFYVRRITRLDGPAWPSGYPFTSVPYTDAGPVEVVEVDW